MTPRVILFALWSLLFVAGTATASYYAWSPFSDEARQTGNGAGSGGRGSGGFYGGRTGPTHK